MHVLCVNGGKSRFYTLHARKYFPRATYRLLVSMHRHWIFGGKLSWGMHVVIKMQAKQIEINHKTHFWLYSVYI